MTMETAGAVPEPVAFPGRLRVQEGQDPQGIAAAGVDIPNESGNVMENR